MKLTAEQQRKAEENMGLVGKVIADKVHGTYFGSYTREDLFQIGCIGLCKAAATDKGGCFLHLRLPAHLERDLHRSDFGHPEGLRGAAHGAAHSGNPRRDRRSSLPPWSWKTCWREGRRTAKGVAKKGIQALRLRLKGYSTREIGACLGAPDNYVTAWEAKARKYLRAIE